MEAFVTGMMRLNSPAASPEHRALVSQMLGGMPWKPGPVIEHPVRCEPVASAKDILDDPLIRDIWPHIAGWAKKELRYDLSRYDACPIQVIPSLDMRSYCEGQQVAGLYRGRHKGIWISGDTLSDTSMLVIVLAHEYMHFVHDLIVDEQDRERCPRIFSEGLAEVGSRAFCQQSRYRLPLHYRNRSWNEDYDLGRQLVEQIASEGYGLDGFTRTFLNDIATNNPWNILNKRFS